MTGLNESDCPSAPVPKSSVQAARPALEASRDSCSRPTSVTIVSSSAISPSGLAKPSIHHRPTISRLFDVRGPVRRS